MKAWQDPIGTIRDVAQGDPASAYHPSISALYTTDVPDGTVNGATLVNDAWVNPAPPPVQPPAPPPAPTIPTSVPMAAARKVLRAQGIKDADVRTAIASSAMTDAQKEDALIDWEFQTSVRRASPLVAALGPALGLTDAQVDALFIAAGAES